MPGLALLFTALLAGAALFVLFIIAAIAGFIWLVALAVFIIGLVKPSRAMRWIGGVPLAGIPLLGLAFAGLMIWAVVYSASPACAYHGVFHEDPTPAISMLQGESSGFGDFSETHLSFKTDRAAFDRLRSKDLMKASPAEYRSLLDSFLNSSPAMAGRKPDETWDIYFRRSDPTNGEHGKVFASETELMGYDPATGMVVYWFLGID